MASSACPAKDVLRQYRTELCVRRFQHEMSQRMANAFGPIVTSDEGVEAVLARESRANGPDPFWGHLVKTEWFNFIPNWEPDAVVPMLRNCITGAAEEDEIVRYCRNILGITAPIYEYDENHVIVMTDRAKLMDEVAVIEFCTPGCDDILSSNRLCVDDVRKCLLRAWRQSVDPEASREARRVLVDLFRRAWSAHSKDIGLHLDSSRFVYRSDNGRIEVADPAFSIFVFDFNRGVRASSGDWRRGWYASESVATDGFRLVEWLRRKLEPRFTFPSNPSNADLHQSWSGQGFPFFGTDRRFYEWIIRGMWAIRSKQAIVCDGTLLVTTEDFARE
jgi:hypothetical protein